ncbi:hypothetical protein J6590_003355 [Homalodisca vitripennis]|nr:hypothetical protein J6590_003355 [Homalodisca vitripennis]
MYSYGYMTNCHLLIFSGEYTKAMNKDWHSGHFCCWQCDESLTGQRYVLRDEHPYCIKCYESVFANGCEECNKTIGIDSKDLSYKDKHWHEACFLCNKCRVSLVDKQFGSKLDKIFCGNCYDAQFASRCDGCGQIFKAGKCAKQLCVFVSDSRTQYTFVDIENHYKHTVQWSCADKEVLSLYWFRDLIFLADFQNRLIVCRALWLASSVLIEYTAIAAFMAMFLGGPQRCTRDAYVNRINLTQISQVLQTRHCPPDKSLDDKLFPVLAISLVGEAFVPIPDSESGYGVLIDNLRNYKTPSYMRGHRRRMTNLTVSRRQIELAGFILESKYWKISGYRAGIGSERQGQTSSRQTGVLAHDITHHYRPDRYCLLLIVDICPRCLEAGEREANI